MAGKKKPAKKSPGSGGSWKDNSIYAQDRANGGDTLGFKVATMVNRGVQKLTQSKSDFARMEKKARKARGGK